MGIGKMKQKDKVSKTVEIIDKGIVHCIAICKDCDWAEMDYIVAKKKARQHCKKYKHIVTIDEGIVYKYKIKKG